MHDDENATGVEMEHIQIAERADKIFLDVLNKALHSELHVWVSHSL